MELTIDKKLTLHGNGVYILIPKSVLDAIDKKVGDNIRVKIIK